MLALYKRIFLLTALLFSVYGFTEEANKPLYWNEVYQEDGTVRPQYKMVVDQISKMTDDQVTEFIAKSKARMSGDTPISPLPRVLTQTEYDTLKTGTEQRAKTIQAFLIDHYSGKHSYRDKIIPGEIIDSIISRTGEANYLDAYKDIGKKNLKFRFLYGPDIIRDVEGNFLVLEDNLGFVGGTPGDTIPARQTWEGLSPELTSKLNIQNKPEDFLTEVMDEMHRLAKPKIGFHDNEGVMVMLSSPPYGDKEDVRMADEFKKRGVVLVTPNMADRGQGRSSKKLVVNEKDGHVYLHETTKYGGQLAPKKVGMIWLNAEHAWVDWQNPVVREKALIEEARDYLDEKGEKLKMRRVLPDGTVITHKNGTKEETKKRLNEALKLDPATGRINLKLLEEALGWAQKNDYAWEPSSLTSKSPFPGLLNAIISGKVQSNYMPGTEFVGDKMFHTYIPALVKHYLGEESILQNPPTSRFFKQDENGKLVIDKDAIDRAMGNRENSVVKVVDGRGGEGIHIGTKLTKVEWKALDPTLQQEFLRYVDQAYRHPSVMEIKNDFGDSREYIADSRMISWVGENRVIVSGTPWGRSTLFKHNGKDMGDSGKVNMSQGTGTLTLMLVVPDPQKVTKGHVVYHDGKIHEVKGVNEDTAKLKRIDDNSGDKSKALLSEVTYVAKNCKNYLKAVVR